MKRIIPIVILSAGLFIVPFMFSSESQAQENRTYKNVNLKYNGISSNPDASAVLYDSRTLVPLRFIAESIGANVNWNGNNRAVTLTSKDKEVKLKIDSEFVTINDVSKKIDYGIPPKIIGNSTMVPLRFISEILDADVEWYSNSYTANVIYPKKHNGNGNIPEEQKSAIDTFIDGSLLNLNKVNIKFDNNSFKTEFPSILYSEKTMVPLRDLANKIGMDVIWNQNDLSITLISDNKNIVLQIGSDKAYINGISKKINASAKHLLAANTEGSFYTMVPVRFITEELGYDVEWNQADTSVNVVEREDKTVTLSDIGININGNSEFVEMYLDNISSPTVDYNGQKTSKINLTIPNGKINIDNLNSYSYDGNGLIKSIRATENSNSTINLVINLSSECILSSNFYGNNLVLQFTQSSINPNPNPSSTIYTKYNMTFDQMINLQISKSAPVTDKHAVLTGYIQADHVAKTGSNSGVVVVSSTNVNLRQFQLHQTLEL